MFAKEFLAGVRMFLIQPMVEYCSPAIVVVVRPLLMRMAPVVRKVAESMMVQMEEGPVEEEKQCPAYTTMKKEAGRKMATSTTSSATS
jgi:hypothetical protein